MTTHSCETCIHSEPRTFADREELRCFKHAQRRPDACGWALHYELDPEFTADPSRCGPDHKWYEAKQ